MKRVGDGTVLRENEAREHSGTSISEQVRKSIDLDRYRVHLLPVAEIKRSPENDELYGAVDGDHDAAFGMLTRSIERLGLEEPLILTQDGYILSGHRRYAAVVALGWTHVPVRFAQVTRATSADYHRLLAQYNPQRVKTVATTLAEQFLLEPERPQQTNWTDYVAARSKVTATFMDVDGWKEDEQIGPRKREFLTAVQNVIAELKPYWPVTVRQVHYRLLNDPPLTQTTKDRDERWRYRNDVASYSKLSDLLVAARYTGAVAFECIHDATRETRIPTRWDSLTEFIQTNLLLFLDGYALDRQQGQAHHVEVLIEKNTLINVVEDICAQFHVPMTPLRGYGGPSIWKDIEDRFQAHEGAEDLVLIIVSDHDPEGFNLADDAVRSLRDRHDLDVEAVRCAVTAEQVQRYGLHPNPAKEKSTRFQEYVERTGSADTYECEALDPEVLRRALHDAILSVLNGDALEAVQEREAEEDKQLRAIRGRLGPALRKLIEKGEL